MFSKLMGNATQKSAAEATTEKVKELYHDFEEIKGRNKRLSVEVFARKVQGLSRDSQGRSNASSYDDVTNMFKGKESIEFSDYLKFVLKVSSDDEVKKVLTDFFQEVENDNGFIKIDELIKLEEKLGRKIDRDEASSIIKEWDSNAEGKLDLDAYLMYKTNNICK